MKIGVPIVGGKLDGDRMVVRVPTFERDGEQYIGIQYKEGDERRWLYMVAGMSPAGAIGIQRGREKDAAK